MVDGFKMKLVLKKLVEVMADFMHLYQPILWMDTAPCHLHASLFDYLGRERILVGLIPSSMTWLLQVLDVKVFALFKRFFKQKFHAKRAQSATGILSCVDVIELIVLTIRKVLEARNWADAFVSLGFCAHQNRVDSFVLENLVMTAVPALPNGKPTRAEITWVYPRNRYPHFDELFRWMDTQINDFLALPAPGAEAPALAAAVEMPHVVAIPAQDAAPAPEPPAVAVALPHAVAIAPKRRSRIMPPSFAHPHSAASSSSHAVDQLDSLLQEQDHIYSWLGSGSVADPS